MNEFNELTKYLARKEVKPKTPYRRPRDAATLILLDREGSAPRILFGKRHEGHAFMPGMFVFPGGSYDAIDGRIAAGTLDALSARRLLQGSPKINATRARGLALAAIRETCEETGLLIGRRDAKSFDAPSPAWEPFQKAGVQPDIGALVFIARAITPPGRPRRFDTRFFAADRKNVAVELPDVAGPQSEFVEIKWLTIPEARKEKLPAITKVILEEIENRLKAGFPPDLPTPFFYSKNGKFHRDEIN
ncbi:MAG TPA: NUDIX hydrolase [Xanthobacteraceae bacterium]|nr:NUDIX hydrolase [Xanthobacteraceae bacterium]